MLLSMLRREWPLVVSIATTALFLVFGKGWFTDLSNAVWFASMLGWLFGAMLVTAFAVVRHAEGLAIRLGEPLGTIVLTLSMSGMKMMMIAAVMYTGHGESSLARDTMLAIVMIVLNGLTGASLLLGGWRYHEQTDNLYGANDFLAVLLPLSVLGLVLPRFTVSSPGPTFSPLRAAFLSCMSVSLYGVFLAMRGGNTSPSIGWKRVDGQAVICRSTSRGRRDKPATKKGDSQCQRLRTGKRRIRVVSHMEAIDVRPLTDVCI
jgi:Ca2+:H+ antiporter